MTPRRLVFALRSLSVLSALAVPGMSLAAIWTSDVRWSGTALILLLFSGWALVTAVILRQANAS